MSVVNLDPQIINQVRSQKWWPIGILIAVTFYLTYAWGAFNMSDVLAGSRLEKGALLLSDAISYKIHVTEDLRRGDFAVAIEGERTATYPEQRTPIWVQRGVDSYSVDLADGYRLSSDGQVVKYQVPNYGTIRILLGKDELSMQLPAGQSTLPEGMQFRTVKFDARPTFGHRVQVSRSKIESHRFFYGWENFWFPFNSPFHSLAFSELWELAISDDRLDDERSNISYILNEFWDNPDWQHGIIAVAVLETVMMAVLGTFTAAFVALPLAFLAARNFNPEAISRFCIRRIFDFVRGIDMLIWSLIFIRAFGLGPLTGTLAIAVTDTGSFGKLFSEAMENVDKKQIEGIEATGASRWQRYRFGVMPQLMPVFMSQFLYWMESNMRSATVIGALGAGGIGLVLVETMRTQRDWENVFYIITITILMVFIMDGLSSRLRLKLIKGGNKDH